MEHFENIIEITPPQVGEVGVKIDGHGGAQSIDK